MSTVDTDRIWFDAVIRPNQAMSRSGLRLVAIGLLAPSFCFGIVMVALRLWPASLFLGGEALLAVAALYWCAKRLGETEERVRLTDDALIVEALDKGKVISSETIQPTWVHIERRIDKHFGCIAAFVRVRRRFVPIARCVSPQERAQIADALEQALQRRKRDFAKAA